MRVLAIFGPTAVGKTGVAIAVAALLRERGEDPVAVSCDAIQVYEGLDVLSGAPDSVERSRLEHRLVGFVPIDGEFSAGRFAHLAHSEIDQLIAEARRPIVVGGTGLYMRAALAELDLRPPVPSEVRAAVEADLTARGPAALHAELSPELASGVHPNDRKRIARLTELGRLGIAAPATGDGLWSKDLRVPTTLVGLTVDPNLLRTRIEARVDAMLRLGAEEEVRSAQAAGASRTARAAIGFEELLSGDTDAMKRAQWRYARRQLTWMRRMEDVTQIDRGGRDDADVAAEIVALLDADGQ
jgi:tRNA dimethylallyltransferase